MRLPDFQLEGAWSGPVIGIDEAGRGPCAGPVVAAAALLKQTPESVSIFERIRDCKQLTRTQRVSILRDLKPHAVFGVGLASVTEIDQLNILQATLLAMSRAVEEVHKQTAQTAAAALIDGLHVPKLEAHLATETKPVVKGDQISASIAAASIVAKVHRDEIMMELHELFPVYGWDRNAGYGTREHLAAMEAHGVTPYHRRSFAPVRRLLSDLERSAERAA